MLIDKIQNKLKDMVQEKFLEELLPSLETLPFFWRSDNPRQSVQGPDPEWSYAGALPDGQGGTDSSGNPVVHDEGVWCGPGYTNELLSGAEDLTNATAWTDSGSDVNVTSLGDGEYRLDATGASAFYRSVNSNLWSSGAQNRQILAKTVSGTGSVGMLLHNGNAESLVNLTEDWQLIEFSADAPVTSFPGIFYAVDFRIGTLESVVVKFPQAVNSEYLFPYIPPAASVVSAASSVGGNGINVPMDTRILDAFGGSYTPSNLVDYSEDLTQWSVNGTSFVNAEGGYYRVNIVTGDIRTTVVNQGFTVSQAPSRPYTNVALSPVERKRLFISDTSEGQYYLTVTAKDDGQADQNRLTADTFELSSGGLLVFYGGPAGSWLHKNSSVFKVPVDYVENLGNVVCLGDSLTLQYPDQFARLFPSSTIFNEGVGGERIDQIEARFATSVSANNPDKIILMCGLNDIKQGADLATIQSRFTSLLALCDAEVGADNVVIGNTTPFRADATSTDEMLEIQLAFNSWLLTLNHTVVDQFSEYLQPGTEGDMIYNYTSDGTHPALNNAANYLAENFAREFGWDYPEYVKTEGVPVQRVFQPATMTLAAVITMGVGSDELVGTTTNRSILTPTNSTSTGAMFYKDGTLESDVRIVSANDGTVAQLIQETWARGETHLKLVQTNAAGTQFRVGSFRVGIDSSIQWSIWSAFDGSFDPLEYLRFMLNNTVPAWMNQVQLWSDVVDDADIIDLVEDQLGKF